MTFALNKLEKRFDLLQYLEQFEYVMSGDNAVLHCPNCERDGKLWVLLKEKRDKSGERVPRGTWLCYYCRDMEGEGTGRTCLSLIEWVERLSFVDAAKRLAEGGTSGDADFIGAIEKTMAGLDVKDEKEEPPPTIALPQQFIPIDEKHYPPYAAERGFSVERCERFGLGYCRKGRYANRLVAPVVFYGRNVGFQARWMAKKPPKDPETGKRISKTKHAFGAKMTKVLYNWDSAREQKRIVLVESPWAVIKIGRSGTGSFGKSLSTSQLELILKSDADELVIGWDLDQGHEAGKGGYDKSLVLAEQISALMPVRALKLRRDIDKMSLGDIRDLIARTPIMSANAAWAERVTRRLEAL